MSLKHISQLVNHTINVCIEIWFYEMSFTQKKKVDRNKGYQFIYTSKKHNTYSLTALDQVNLNQVYWILYSPFGGWLRVIKK